MQALLAKHQGAAQSTVTVEVVFTGTSVHPTRILDVKIDRLRRPANLTSLRTECPGDPPARLLEVDLDTPPRDLMSDGEPYFVSKDLEVSIEERENLRIFVTAGECSCRWMFAVDYLDSTVTATRAYFGVHCQLHDWAEDVPQDAEFSLTIGRIGGGRCRTAAGTGC